MMKNKAFAIALPIIAIAILFFVFMGSAATIAFDLKSTDGQQVFENVPLPENTQFPVKHQGKDCLQAFKYRDSKTNKVIFVAGDDPILPHYVQILPGLPAEKK